MNNLQSQQLVEAIQIWSGRYMSPMPSRSEQRVLQKYGVEKGIQLMKEIKQLEDDFYASDAHITAASLQEMHVQALEAFRNKHTHLDVEIGNILAWCYTYDYK